jgi:hypothetical protein
LTLLLFTFGSKVRLKKLKKLSLSQGEDHDGFKVDEGFGLNWSCHKCVGGCRFKWAVRSITTQRIMRMLALCAAILKKRWSLSYQNSVLEWVLQVIFKDLCIVICVVEL